MVGSKTIGATSRAGGLVATNGWCQLGTVDADAGDDPTAKTVNISTSDPTVAMHDATQPLAFLLLSTTAPHPLRPTSKAVVAAVA